MKGAILILKSDFFLLAEKMLGLLPVLPVLTVLFATAMSDKILPHQTNEWLPYTAQSSQPPTNSPAAEEQLTTQYVETPAPQVDDTSYQPPDHLLVTKNEAQVPYSIAPKEADTTYSSDHQLTNEVGHETYYTAPQEIDAWYNSEPIYSNYAGYQDPNIYSAPQPAYQNVYQSSPDVYYESQEAVDVPVDVLSDKNYKPKPVATAQTGGLPFIIYALKNILWLIIVGTIFLMFVGTVCAYAYRVTHAYHGGSFGRITELDTTELVYKAIQLWRDVQSQKDVATNKLK